MRTKVFNKSIGFDFDQTLADTTRGITECLHYVCYELGINASSCRIEKLSISGLQLKDILGELVPSSLIDKATKIFMHVYPTKGINGTRLFPGVTEMFEDLRKKKIETYILSAKSIDNLLLSLVHLKLDVNHAFGGLDYDGKVALIEKFKLPIYVGDQNSDIKAALQAGCRGILISKEAPKELSPSIYTRFNSITDFHESLSDVLDRQFML